MSMQFLHIQIIAWSLMHTKVKRRFEQKNSIFLFRLSCFAFVKICWMWWKDENSIQKCVQLFYMQYIVVVDVVVIFISSLTWIIPAIFRDILSTHTEVCFRHEFVQCTYFKWQIYIRFDFLLFFEIFQQNSEVQLFG